MTCKPSGSRSEELRKEKGSTRPKRNNQGQESARERGPIYDCFEGKGKLVMLTETIDVLTMSVELIYNRLERSGHA